MKDIKFTIAIKIHQRNWFKLSNYAENNGWVFERTSSSAPYHNYITGWFFGNFKDIKEFEKKVLEISKFNEGGDAYVSSISWKEKKA